MREAKRLFSKPKNKSLHNQPSSVFQSKIVRDIPNPSKDHTVGPGQYNISFPIVRPRFQAIRKNHNTIIIKINEKLSPAFKSISPRFKQTPTYQHERSEGEIQNYQMIEHNQSQGGTHNRQIERGMKNRIRKLNEIFHQEEQSKKNLLLSLNQGSTDRLQKIKGSSQVVNSLKLYKKERERLHFLLKHMRHNKPSKGVQWSKYRQTKGNLYHINNVPGPGAYQQPPVLSTRTRYFETIDEHSWQFKSLTRRGYYLDSQQKSYELSPTRNRFISDINGKFHKVDSIPLMHDRSVTKIEIDNQQA